MTRKKAKGNRKGRPFEIMVARLLSLWWTDNEDDFVFFHSHSSGAMATSNAKTGKSRSGHHGDIAYVKAIGEPLIRLVCMECKKGYGKATVIDFLDGTRYNHEYKQWLVKARRDAKATGAKYWWIIHRRDAKNILLTTSQGFWEALCDSVGRSVPFFPLVMTVARTKGTKYVRLVTVPFEEFLKIVSPDDIKEILE